MAHDLTTSRRDEVIVAAACLFEEKGFHHTSMHNIAESVGIRKSTLYHHVTSKSQIVSWIHNEIADELLSQLQQRIDSGMRPRDNLYWVVRDILTSLESKPGYLRVFFDTHREMDEPYLMDAGRRRDQYSGLVEGVIREGVELGELQIDDIKLTMLALFGMCNWAYQWFVPGGRLGVEEIAAYFWLTAMNGMSAEIVKSLPSGAIVSPQTAPPTVTPSKKMAAKKSAPRARRPA